jgi:RZ type zinc finger domain
MSFVHTLGREFTAWRKALVLWVVECGCRPISGEDVASLDHALFMLLRGWHLGEAKWATVWSCAMRGEPIDTLWLPGALDEQMAMLQQSLSSSLGWYRCPNGHLYAIGECTRPMEVGQCVDCGAEIGGRNHQNVSSVTRVSALETLVRGHRREPATQLPGDTSVMLFLRHISYVAQELSHALHTCKLWSGSAAAVDLGVIQVDVAKSRARLNASLRRPLAEQQLSLLFHLLADESLNALRSYPGELDEQKVNAFYRAVETALNDLLRSPVQHLNRFAEDQESQGRRFLNEALRDAFGEQRFLRLTGAVENSRPSNRVAVCPPRWSLPPPPSFGDFL